MSTMAEAAFRQGLAGIAFTEHVEWVPEDGATGYLRPAAYFAELETLRVHYGNRFWLLAGAEVGNSHDYREEARGFLDAWPWDYVLGSAHWADELPVWEPVAFDEGLDSAIERYFRELAQLAELGEYDVLAHFDLVRRDAWSILGERLDLTPYSDLIHEALRVVVERGKGLEINTSALGQGLEEPLPGLEILRWYRELGGEILVFGSDAHHPEQLGRGFDQARSLALAAGFERLARFQGRRVVEWIPL
jgi:histidinol-phosphatase (PHP family)